MLPITLEWVSKAEGDYDVVCLLLKSRKRSRFDAICFHSQQCVEKYSKARLTESGVPFPKSHDLVLLLNLSLPVEPLWVRFQHTMATLASSAIGPRYPGTISSSADSRDAVRICREFRLEARRSLGLK